jgi:hypothetical protein
MDFRQYLEDQNLNEKTIDTHVRNLAAYGVVGASQNIMINKLNLNETWPRRLSRANTLSKYLQYKQRPNDEIVAYIQNANKEIQKESTKRQMDMADDPSLPTLKELKSHMNSLYDKGDYRGFCIMYLFITYTVRNQDLIAKVVKSKKQANETDNFFIVGRKQVTWIRNKYKTADKYGTKTHVIKNEKFVTAIKTLDYLLKENQNIDRIIKKITAGIGHITESTILKVVLKYSNNMNNLRRISHNRGTDMTTLVENYNIT